MDTSMAYFLRFLPAACLLTLLIATAGAQTTGIVGGRLNAPVNDSLNDYSPAVFFSTDPNGNDRLYFTSDRTDIYSKGKKAKKALRGEMWYSSRPASYRKTKPLNADWCSPSCELVSTADQQFPTFTRGALTMDESRTLIVFASERALVEGKLSSGNTSHMFDLWSTTDNFQTVTPLTAVNSDYWESHPALMPDGSMLFFTSNRPVLLNGQPDSSLNIYYSTRENGNWTDPELVPGINTPGDEVSPHCGSDGFFYYSSNWKNSATADFDIYRAALGAARIPVGAVLIEESLRKNSRRELPETLPYNSPANDMFAYVTPDKTGLFFASDRDNAKLDIYAYSFPKPVIIYEATVIEQILDKDGNLLQAWTPKQQRWTAPEYNMAIEAGKAIELEPYTRYSIPSPLRDSSCFTCTAMPRVAEFTTGGEDAIVRDTFRITCRQQADSAIVFSDAETGTPYFITGYWWPNTTHNLKTYRERTNSGALKTSGFIDESDYAYDKAAQKIDEHFEKNIYRRIESMLSQIASQCWSKPVLMITVHGYTDECSLSPGAYSADGTVTVGDIVIPQGQNMQSAYAQHITGGKVALPDSGQNGNIFLSKLRAYFTIETIKKEMSGRSELFRQLAENGQVQFEADGFGIFGKKECDNSFVVPGLDLSADPLNPEPCNKPRSRMFVVYLNVLTPEQAEGFRLGRCGKESSEYVRWTRTWQKKQQQVAQRQEQEAGERDQRRKQEEEKKQQGGASAVAGILYSIQYGTAADDSELKVAEAILRTLGYDYTRPKKNSDGIYVLLSPPLYPSEEEAQTRLSEYKNRAEALRRMLQPEIVQRQ